MISSRCCATFLMLLLCGLCLVEAACNNTVLAHLSYGQAPLNVTLTGESNGGNSYFDVNVPVAGPNQGWGVVFTFPDPDGWNGGLSYHFNRYISNDGSNVFYECETLMSGGDEASFYLYPCDTHAQYLNVTRWFVNVRGVYDANGTIQVVLIDLPAPVPLPWGYTDVVTYTNKPTVYELQLTEDLNSMYVMVNAAWAFVSLSADSVCGNTIWSGKTSGKVPYAEADVEIYRYKKVYMFVRPSTTPKYNIALQVERESRSDYCRIPCDEEGGSCYVNTCSCKSGYYGPQCAQYSCKAIIPKPCDCTMGTIGSTATHIDSPNELAYFQFVVNDLNLTSHQGWSVKVNYGDDDASYSLYPNNGLCPRGENGISATSVHHYDDNETLQTYQIGVRSCSRQMQAVSNISKFIFEVTSATNSSVTVIPAPLPQQVTMTTGNAVIGQIDDWNSVLVSYSVPTDVNRITFHFQFANEQGLIPHTLTVQQAPCDFTNSVVHELGTSFYNSVTFNATAGQDIFLLVTSQSGNQPKVDSRYKFIITTN